MTQAELNRAVATVTGETVKTISQLGFSVADPNRVCHDPEPYEPGVHVVDWDELDAQRVGVFPQRRRRELAVA